MGGFYAIIFASENITVLSQFISSRNAPKFTIYIINIKIYVDSIMTLKIKHLLRDLCEEDFIMATDF